VLRRFLVRRCWRRSSSPPGPGAQAPARAQDDPKEQRSRRSRTREAAKARPTTAEQIAETVVLVYGSRPGLAQVAARASSAAR
jgi:hypothetical protein